MTQITINAETRERLCSAGEPVQLVDEDGRVVGTFRPIDVTPYDPDLLPPPLEASELERRLHEPARPLSNILHDLRQQQP